MLPYIQTLDVFEQIPFFSKTGICSPFYLLSSFQISKWHPLAGNARGSLSPLGCLHPVGEAGLYATGGWASRSFFKIFFGGPSARSKCRADHTRHTRRADRSPCMRAVRTARLYHGSLVVRLLLGARLPLTQKMHAVHFSTSVSGKLTHIYNRGRSRRCLARSLSRPTGAPPPRTGAPCHAIASPPT